MYGPGTGIAHMLIRKAKSAGIQRLCLFGSVARWLNPQRRDLLAEFRHVEAPVLLEHWSVW